MRALRSRGNLGSALAIAVLLASPLLALGMMPAAQAQASSSSNPVQLEYTVNLENADLLRQGKVQMTWRASGFANRVTAFCLQTDNHEYAVDRESLAVQGSAPGQWDYHPVAVEPQNSRPACPAGFRSVVQGSNSVQATFSLSVRKAAFSACGCEFNSYLGPDWGVVKAEALSIPFSYSFFNEPGCASGQQCPPPFRATVRFQLPAGWNAEGPWTKLDARTFELTTGDRPLPRGFFAVGNFTPELRDESSLGKQFVYVRLAQELRQKDLLFDYLRKATPYYQSVYGNSTGARVLVVSAGAPMFTGGLGSTDSLFVHQNATIETIAHEYAHVWQRFQTVDQASSPGGTSIWVNEGDADLHGALSRFVTEIQADFDYAKMNEEFRRNFERYSTDPEFQQPLSAACYGCATEQVAYKKGFYALLDLDAQFRALTGNVSGVNDYLAALNAYYDTVVQNRTVDRQRVTNEDLLLVANQLARKSNPSADLGNFWATYVNGTAWPPLHDAPQEAPVVFDGLVVEPAQPIVGQNVTVKLNVINARESPVTRSVVLIIDNAVAQSETITLGPLQSLPVQFSIASGASGRHTVQVAYLRGSYTALKPAEVIVRSMMPLVTATPEVGVPFPFAVQLENIGEASATVTVEVHLGEVVERNETELAGMSSQTLHVMLNATQEGNASARVTVTWSGGALVREAGFRIAPRDTDADGTPDATDAYPDNPRLSQKSPVNDVRTNVPAAETVWVAVALSAALALGRRRR